MHDDRDQFQYESALRQFHGGDLAAARRSGEELLARHPALAPVLHLMGLIANAQGRLPEAETFIRRAVAAGPFVPDHHNSLGVVLARLGQIEPALAAFDAAIRLRADYAAAHRNRGNALERLGRPDESASAYRTSLRSEPTDFATWQSLSAVCHQNWDLDGAIECRRRMVDLRPSDGALGSDLLYMLHYSPSYGPQQVFAEHVAWAARHAEPLTERALPHENHPDPSRRLRIGYLSFGFRDHPVARFQEASLAFHDRRRFEIFCYANVGRPDPVTARLQHLAEHWAFVTGWSDEQVAAKIRADKIDILVDLDGHSTGNRLLVLARRPAPVQATYNGYIGTTGMSAIDWRITDSWHDPVPPSAPGHVPTVSREQFHTEKLNRLEGGNWCYRPDDASPEVAPPPSQRLGYVTFGCLNKLVKVTPAVAGLWARILGKVPSSRLLLLAPGPQRANATVLRKFAVHGLAPDRVKLLFPAPRSQYMRWFNEIDIALDPFPFNGITTTCDGLWMGVPLVTLAGSTFVSRAGVSLLNMAGVPEFIAGRADDYEHIAVSLASDPARLASLRRLLRQRMRESLLCDGPRLARSLERSYRAMWQDWCLSHAV